MFKLTIITLLIAAVAVPSALLATQGQRTAGEARVSAYKHEDGRIEFGIQVREGDGWSERILPRVRMLRANSAAGRWLSSSPVVIPNNAPDVRLPVFYPPSDDNNPFGTRVEFSAENFNDPQFWRTKLRFWAARSNDNRVQRAHLEFTCDEGYIGPNGARGYEFGGQWGIVGIAADLHRPVVAVAEGTELGSYSPHNQGPMGPLHDIEATERIWRWSDWESVEMNTREFMLAIKQYNELTIAVSDRTGTVVTVSFDLGSAFWTPIQPNLDYCGEY